MYGLSSCRAEVRSSIVCCTSTTYVEGLIRQVIKNVVQTDKYILHAFGLIEMYIYIHIFLEYILLCEQLLTPVLDLVLYMLRYVSKTALVLFKSLEGRPYWEKFIGVGQPEHWKRNPSPAACLKGASSWKPPLVGAVKKYESSAGEKLLGNGFYFSL